MLKVSSDFLCLVLSVELENYGGKSHSGERRQPSQPLSPLYHHLVLSLVDNYLALYVLYPRLLKGLCVGNFPMFNNHNQVSMIAALLINQLNDNFYY